MNEANGDPDGIATGSVTGPLTRYQLDVLLYLGVEERVEPVTDWLERYGHDSSPGRLATTLETLAEAGLLERAGDREPPYRLTTAGTSLLRRRAQQYELTFTDRSGSASIDGLLDPEDELD